MLIAICRHVDWEQQILQESESTPFGFHKHKYSWRYTILWIITNDYLMAVIVGSIKPASLFIHFMKISKEIVASSVRS